MLFVKQLMKCWFGNCSNWIICARQDGRLSLLWFDPLHHRHQVIVADFFTWKKPCILTNPSVSHPISNTTTIFQLEPLAWSMISEYWSILQLNNNLRRLILIFWCCIWTVFIYIIFSLLPRHKIQDNIHVVKEFVLECNGQCFTLL